MLDVKGLAKAARAEGGPIEIEKQMTLPWTDAFRISLRNVTLRLGRAAITAAGVVLGIAFLASVWTSKVVVEGLELSQEEAHRRQVEAVQTAAGVEEEAGTATEVVTAEEKANRAARQAWLVIMSLLVCTVGITNSMLMSVTERFQEIGTMKCLGALDMFIVRLFLIESILIGLLGSLVGVLIGHLIMLLVFCIKEGWDTPAKMDWAAMAVYMLVAVAIGTLLSLVAAVGPAVRAARMPPAAALQTEI